MTTDRKKVAIKTLMTRSNKPAIRGQSKIGFLGKIVGFDSNREIFKNLEKQ